MPLGPPHGKSKGGGGMRRRGPIAPHGGGGAWVSANTLPVNPTWRTASCMSSVTSPTGTSSMFTSLWVTMDIYPAMALAAVV